MFFLSPLMFLLSTDYFILARKSTAFFLKDTAWLRIDIIHGTSWLRLALQVHGLVTFFNISIFQFSIFNLLSRVYL